MCNARERQELVVISSSETDAARAALQQSGYTVAAASGAGYKLLCVALGVVKCYALTKDSTYAWDTCAAHAMLASLGGSVCRRGVRAEPLTYRPKDAAGQGQSHHCNAGGIIASRDPRIVDRVHEVLLDCNRWRWLRTQQQSGAIAACVCTGTPKQAIQQHNFTIVTSRKIAVKRFLEISENICYFFFFCYRPLFLSQRRVNIIIITYLLCVLIRKRKKN